MSKFGRIFLGIIVFVLAAVFGLGWFLLEKLDELTEYAIEDHGSRVLGSTVQVDAVDLALFSGRGTVRGLSVANPDGFSAGDALRLGEIKLVIDVESLTGPVIRLHEITVDQPRVLIEQKRDGRVNLDALRRQVQEVAGSGQDQDSDAGSGRRLAIAAFNFLGAEVELDSELGAQRTVSIPDIRLTDIGDARSGLSVAEAVGRMLKPVVNDALRQGVRDEMRERLEDKVREAVDKNENLKKLKGLLGDVPPPPETQTDN